MSKVLISFGYDEKLPEKPSICVLREVRVIPGAKVYVLESPLQIEGLAKKIGWATVLQPLEIVLVEKGEEADQFQRELESAHLAASLILSEASDYQVGALQNALANQGQFRRGKGLKGAFSNLPAVIIGAGPSLKKNRHLLPLFQNKALLLAGGSALSSQLGIEPHLAASIDKEAPFAQFKTHPFFEVPFCYQARMNRDNFSLLHGEKLLFPDSSSPAINWLQGDDELFNGGWTVGNFLTAIAVMLGCNPIIFVGMDLCYEAGKKYADVESSLPEGLIQVGSVWTQSDWLMSARWTEELARNHPEIRFINASEGGLGFGLPIETRSLSEVLSECPDQLGLKQAVHSAIQKLPLEATDQDRLQEWKEQLEYGGEVVEEKLLTPLWQIWKSVFERELERDNTPLSLEEKLQINQTLFFEQVLQEHRHE